MTELRVVAYLAVPAGAAGYFLWIYALRNLTPIQTVVFVNFNPLSATILSVSLLREDLTTFLLLGLILVLVSVFLTNYPQKQEVPIVVRDDTNLEAVNTNEFAGEYMSRSPIGGASRRQNPYGILFKEKNLFPSSRKPRQSTFETICTGRTQISPQESPHKRCVTKFAA